MVYFKPAKSPINKNRNILPVLLALDSFYPSCFIDRKIYSGAKDENRAQAEGQNILINNTNFPINSQLKNQVFP